MPERPEHTFRKMSRIRASGSQIERHLGRALWRAGLRYRKQYPVPGRPDFALVSFRIAIFCDSNFWHGYRWGAVVKSTFKRNRRFWILKIEANRQRDRRINRKLRRLGWIVLRFWEGQIKDSPEACVSAVLRATAIARPSTAQIRNPKVAADGTTQEMEQPKCCPPGGPLPAGRAGKKPKIRNRRNGCGARFQTRRTSS
jgi:DNA mismatch endonuclease (patch repair protein)